jgi:hypothetical protein
VVTFRRSEEPLPTPMWIGFQDGRVYQVFVYVADATKLPTWRRNVVSAVPDGPMGLGTEIREAHRATGGETDRPSSRRPRVRAAETAAREALHESQELETSRKA